MREQPVVNESNEGLNSNEAMRQSRHARDYDKECFED